MYALVTLPTPSNLFTDVGTWSTAAFTELLIFVALIVGLIVGGMAVAKLISVTIGAAKKVVGGKRRGGRRGRR